MFLTTQNTSLLVTVLQFLFTGLFESGSQIGVGRCDVILQDSKSGNVIIIAKSISDAFAQVHNLYSQPYLVCLRLPEGD